VLGAILPPSRRFGGLVAMDLNSMAVPCTCLIKLREKSKVSSEDCATLKMALRRIGSSLYRNTVVASKEATVEVARDYRDVFVKMGKDAIASPVSTLMKLAAAAGFVYICSEAPDDYSYDSQLMDANSDLIECAGVHSAKSSNYVMPRMELRGQGLLAFLYLGPINVVYSKPYRDELKEFSGTWQPWLEGWKWTYKHVVDVGYMRRWPALEQAMEDYDIPEELV
jgi:hypothetical protein